MGSRALLVVCRDAGVAVRRFGVATGETGAIYTRTGRAFFDGMATTEAMLARVRGAMTEAGFWQRLDTDWALLDAEIMPWSAKAQGLLARAVRRDGRGRRRRPARSHGVARAGPARTASTSPSSATAFAARARRAGMYVEAYRRYCWPVKSLDDYRIAPFHMLATEGAVHADKDHLWHMHEIARLADDGDVTLICDAPPPRRSRG